MKKTLLNKSIATILCLLMILTAIPCTQAQAATAEAKALTLKYNGKTATLINASASSPEAWDKLITLSDLKKKFGAPKKDKANTFEQYIGYKYTKKKGVKFTFYTQEGLSHIGGLELIVTSKNATVNGIRVGMKFNTVKKKLEKAYGKELVEASSDKKKITLNYAALMPLEIAFKKGKVSKIHFFCS